MEGTRAVLISRRRTGIKRGRSKVSVDSVDATLIVVCGLSVKLLPKGQRTRSNLRCSCAGPPLFIAKRLLS